MSFLTPFLPAFSLVGASLVTPAAVKLWVRRSPSRFARKASQGTQVELLRSFQVVSCRFMLSMRFMRLHRRVVLISLMNSKPPAPLNACVIRGVFFCTPLISFGMPAAPLNFFGNLLRNSAGFSCPQTRKAGAHG